MAKVKKPTKADISAVLSDHVVLRKIRGQSVLSAYKPPRESKSERKKASQDKMKYANSWASAILKNADAKKMYSKGINSALTNAHAVARKDFLNAPEIHYVSLKDHTGIAGSKIRIKATDDFQVTEIDVVITNKNGKKIESGAAKCYAIKPRMWVYTLKKANPKPAGTVIKITAQDLPGNKDSKEVTISTLQELSKVHHFEVKKKKKTKKVGVIAKGVTDL